MNSARFSRPSFILRLRALVSGRITRSKANSANGASSCARNRSLMPSHYTIAAILSCLLCAAAFARDPSQVRAFRHAHPCPATGKTSGACPGWVVDHILPLCSGAPDKPGNMQWQAKAESLAKDKREAAYCACLRHGKGGCVTP